MWGRRANVVIDVYKYIQKLDNLYDATCVSLQKYNSFVFKPTKYCKINLLSYFYKFYVFNSLLMITPSLLINTTFFFS